MFAFKTLSAPMREFKAILVHCVAIGGNSAVYLATTDLPRSKGVTSQGRITEMFEGSGIAADDLTAIIKIFDDRSAFQRELHILPGLQRCWKGQRNARNPTEPPGPFDEVTFGPEILGYNEKHCYIMYERLKVTEQSCFYNGQSQRLSLKHFPSLLHQVLFMHSQGIVRQDIRSPNVGFRGERPILFDLGFATILENSPLADVDFFGPYRLEGYCGSRETASNEIMKILSVTPDATVIATPKDDLISLYKLWHIAAYGPSIAAGCQNWNELYRAWRINHTVRALEEMEPDEIAKKMMDIFRDCDEGNLPLYLEKNEQAGTMKNLRELYVKAKSVQLGVLENAGNSEADFFDDILQEIPDPELSSAVLN